MLSLPYDFRNIFFSLTQDVIHRTHEIRVDCLRYQQGLPSTAGRWWASSGEVEGCMRIFACTEGQRPNPHAVHGSAVVETSTPHSQQLTGPLNQQGYRRKHGRQLTGSS